MTQEWQELFFTCDEEGSFVKLGGPKGRVFPNKEKEHIFDVKLPNGTIYEKCYIYSPDFGISISGITQDGEVLQLKNRTLLMSNPNPELENKLNKIYLQIMQKLNEEQRITRLQQRKTELEKELEYVIGELNKLT